MGRSQVLDWKSDLQRAYSEYSVAQGDAMDSEAQLSFTAEELHQTASKVLRILLSQPGGASVLHTQLKAKVLGADDASETSKCLFELAVLSLVEQQLVVRHGFGGSAMTLYSVPDTASARAEQTAYLEFPDDSRFVCTARRVSARQPLGLSRRHGSPRQLSGRTRGVEKSRTRQKRAVSDDAAAQKRMRVDGNCDSGCTPMSP